ncbi:MAG: DUF2520 domain-containing protein [Actinobacteria bacterium]|nr:DUF2520 domain-containing protein [Actinomycetota bacterium]
MSPPPAPFPSPPPIPFTFSLAGAGRVGTATAVLLSAAGHAPVGVASRTPASAERAAGLLGTDVYPFEDLPGADVVLIGAGDDSIEEVASLLAPDHGSVAIHFAGSLDLTILRSLTSAGAGAAALHPVQACPSVEAAIERIPGSAWGVTCSEGLEEWAAAVISDDLRGTAYPVAPQDRAAWHAASVVSANGISALLSAGERILSSIGVSDPIEVLGPLAAGSIANARDAGGGTATLTGPVVRGEIATVERHLNGLAGTTGYAPYVTATLAIIAAALASDRIDTTTADEMRALIEERS